MPVLTHYLFDRPFPVFRVNPFSRSRRILSTGSVNRYGRRSRKLYQIPRTTLPITTSVSIISTCPARLPPKPGAACGDRPQGEGHANGILGAPGRAIAPTGRWRVLCLGIADTTWHRLRLPPQQPAPAPQPVSSARPPMPPIPVTPPALFQVFPRVATSLAKPAPEGAVPVPTPQAGPAGLYAPVKRRSCLPTTPGPASVCGQFSITPRPATSATGPRRGGLGGVPLYRPAVSYPPQTRTTIPTDLEPRLASGDMRGLFPGILPRARHEHLVQDGTASPRLDAMFDANPIGGTDSFVTAANPRSAGARAERRRQPPLQPTGAGHLDADVIVRLDGSHPDRSGLLQWQQFRRVRLLSASPPASAYADLGPFRLGQAALPTFMDYDVFPNVLDYQGPNGMVLMRQVVARATIPLSDQFHIAVAAEQPYSDIQWFQDGEFVVNPGSRVVTSRPELPLETSRTCPTSPATSATTRTSATSRRPGSCAS